MNSIIKTSVVIAAVILTALPLVAQEKKKKGPPPSPPAKIHVEVDGANVSIAYSRPHTVKPGTTEVRKIWGGLVPYGKVWRTGANEATTLTTDKDLVIGGKDVPAGKYTLYTLPEEDGSAKLIINKQTGQWGTVYNEDQDLARVDMKKESLSEPVDQFTMALAMSGSSGTLKMSWEKTAYSVDFTVKK